MPIQNLLGWRKFFVLFVVQIWFPANVTPQDVTLQSLEILKKHEWLKTKLTVYFQCKGENKTKLPDVTKKHVLYTFRGQESWQPLTEIHGSKCKRCGFYERRSIRSDSVFDEWEFCPSDFSPGKSYVHFKHKEMNATFLCHGCTQPSSGTANATASPRSGSRPQKEEEIEIKLVAVIAASATASAAIVIGVIALFRYVQRKKRQQDQARFMKLFEDGDEIEEELGLGTVM